MNNESEIVKLLQEFIYQCQHHSGLSRMNILVMSYLFDLIAIYCPDYLCYEVIDDVINKYMINTHNLYRQTKTWKSYDW